MKRKLLSGLSALLCACLLAGCGNSQPSAATTVLGTEDSADAQQSLVSQEDLTPKDNGKKPGYQLEMPEEGEEIAVITMETGEVIKLRFFPDEAPKAVYNFKVHALEGYYDGLTFHRVIDDFMIQGGDPEGTGMGGPGWQIKGEFAANGWNNPIRHTRGVISMARAMDPDSAGSQFFIMHEDAPHLDGQYAAFGRVVRGMEVVDEIAETPTDRRDKPLTPVVMARVEVVDDEEA